MRCKFVTSTVTAIDTYSSDVIITVIDNFSGNVFVTVIVIFSGNAIVTVIDTVIVIVILSP